MQKSLCFRFAGFISAFCLAFPNPPAFALRPSIEGSAQSGLEDTLLPQPARESRAGMEEEWRENLMDLQEYATQILVDARAGVPVSRILDGFQADPEEADFPWDRIRALVLGSQTELTPKQINRLAQTRLFILILLMDSILVLDEAGTPLIPAAILEQYGTRLKEFKHGEGDSIVAYYAFLFQTSPDDARNLLSRLIPIFDIPIEAGLEEYSTPAAVPNQRRVYDPWGCAIQLLDAVAAQSELKGLVILSEAQARRRYLSGRHPIPKEAIREMDDLLADALLPVSQSYFKGSALREKDSAVTLRQRGTFILVTEDPAVSKGPSERLRAALMISLLFDRLSENEKLTGKLKLSYRQFRQLVPSPSINPHYAKTHPEVIGALNEFSRAGLGGSPPNRKLELPGFLLWHMRPAQQLRKQKLTEVRIVVRPAKYDRRKIAENLLVRVAQELAQNEGDFRRRYVRDSQLMLTRTYVESLGEGFPTEAALRQSEDLSVQVQAAANDLLANPPEPKTSPKLVCEAVESLREGRIRGLQIVGGSAPRNPSLSPALAMRLILVALSNAPGLELPRGAPLRLYPSDAGRLVGEERIADYLRRVPGRVDALNILFENQFETTNLSPPIKPEEDPIGAIVQEMKKAGATGIYIEKGTKPRTGLEEDEVQGVLDAIERLKAQSPPVVIMKGTIRKEAGLKGRAFNQLLKGKDSNELKTAIRANQRTSTDVRILRAVQRLGPGPHRRRAVAGEAKVAENVLRRRLKASSEVRAAVLRVSPDDQGPAKGPDLGAQIETVIETLPAGGRTREAIARKLGVQPETVSKHKMRNADLIAKIEKATPSSSLPTHDAAILVAIRDNGAITTRAIAQATGITQRSVQRRIKANRDLAAALRKARRAASAAEAEAPEAAAGTPAKAPAPKPTPKRPAPARKAAAAPTHTRAPAVEPPPVLEEPPAPVKEYDHRRVGLNLIMQAAQDLRTKPTFRRQHVQGDQLQLPYSYVESLGRSFPTESELRRERTLVAGINRALNHLIRREIAPDSFLRGEAGIRKIEVVPEPAGLEEHTQLAGFLLRSILSPQGTPDPRIAPFLEQAADFSDPDEQMAQALLRMLRTPPPTAAPIPPDLLSVNTYRAGPFARRDLSPDDLEQYLQEEWIPTLRKVLEAVAAQVSQEGRTVTAQELGFDTLKNLFVLLSLARDTQGQPLLAQEQEAELYRWAYRDFPQFLVPLLAPADIDRRQLQAALENPFRVSNDQGNAAMADAIQKLLSDPTSGFKDDEASLRAKPHRYLARWIHLLLALNLIDYSRSSILAEIEQEGGLVDYVLRRRNTPFLQQLGGSRFLRRFIQDVLHAGPDTILAFVPDNNVELAGSLKVADVLLAVNPNITILMLVKADNAVMNDGSIRDSNRLLKHPIYARLQEFMAQGRFKLIPGTPMHGTPLHLLPQEALDALNAAHIVFSEGEANTWNLNGLAKTLYLGLRLKWPDGVKHIFGLDLPPDIAQQRPPAFIRINGRAGRYYNNPYNTPDGGERRTIAQTVALQLAGLEEIRVEILASAREIDPLLGPVAELLQQSGVSDNTRFVIQLALFELIGNITRHGYRTTTEDLAAGKWDAARENYRTAVTARVEPNRVVVEIADQTNRFKREVLGEPDPKAFPYKEEIAREPDYAAAITASEGGRYGGWGFPVMYGYHIESRKFDMPYQALDDPEGGRYMLTFPRTAGTEGGLEEISPVVLQKRALDQLGNLANAWPEHVGTRALVFTDPELFDLAALAVRWGWRVAVPYDGPEIVALEQLLLALPGPKGEFAIGTLQAARFLETAAPLQIENRPQAFQILGLRWNDLPRPLAAVLETVRAFLDTATAA